MNNLDQYNSVLFLDKILEVIEEERQKAKNDLNPNFQSTYKRIMGYIEGLDFTIIAINNAKKRYGLDE